MACMWASDAVDSFFVSLIFKFLVSFYITPYFDVTADKSLYISKYSKSCLTPGTPPIPHWEKIEQAIKKKNNGGGGGSAHTIQFHDLR